MRMNNRCIWLWLALVGVLTGCGSSSIGGGSNADQGPDRVQIQVLEVGQSAPGQPVAFEQADQVRHFYQTINTLSPYPKDAICTTEMGPRYTMTFSQSGKTTLSVTAERYGCQRLTLGKTDQRQGNRQFWQELDQLLAKKS